MQWCGMLVLLMFAAGRATPLVYKPIESEPVRVGADDFKASVPQLVLDVELDVQ